MKFIKILLSDATNNSSIDFFVLPKEDELDENKNPVFNEKAVMNLPEVKSFIDDTDTIFVNVKYIVYEIKDIDKEESKVNVDDLRVFEQNPNIIEISRNDYPIDTRQQSFVDKISNVFQNKTAVVVIIAVIILIAAVAVTVRNSIDTEQSTEKTETVPESTEITAAESQPQVTTTAATTATPEPEPEPELLPEITNYKLNYNLNGGHGVAIPGDYAEGETVALPKDVEKPGHVLVGWTESPDFEPTFDFVIPSRNVTLYAMWQGKPHNVHFNANGGVGYIPDSKVNTGDEVILPYINFSRTGYELQGWSAVAEAAMPSAVIRMEDNDMTLFAIWRKVEETAENTSSSSQNSQKAETKPIIPGNGKYGGGYGTKASPYIISAYTHLEEMSKTNATGYFKQTADITFSGNISHKPINADNLTYDGQNFTIRNMKTESGGLFGVLKNSTVKNIIVENANLNVNIFEDRNKNIGVIANSAAKSNQFTNCVVRNSKINIESLRLFGRSNPINAPLLEPEINVGGITGYGGVIANSMSDNVTFTVTNVTDEYVDTVGGISGNANSITNCTAAEIRITGVLIESTDSFRYSITAAGGISGANTGINTEDGYVGGEITGCISDNVSITNASVAGEISGEAQAALITNSYYKFYTWQNSIPKRR